MCFIVCVPFLFFLFFCLMIGKIFVMFGYANKEFEFEFEHLNDVYLKGGPLNVIRYILKR